MNGITVGSGVCGRVEPGSIAGQVRKIWRRDLWILFSAVLVALVSVFLFDTGSLAEWVARHKNTKADEVIVVTIVLAIGLGVISIRRWLELSRQISQYDDLYAEMTRLNRESALLSELAEMLQSCLSLNEAHKLLTDRARLLFPNTGGAVCVTASSRDMVEVVASWGEPSLAERFFAPTDCWALRRGRVHLLDEPLALNCAHAGAERPDWAMCVPMMAHGETLGMLYLDSSKKTRGGGSDEGLTEPKQRLAKTLAEHAALALTNLNMREILKMQSVRDPLTGLYNRRYMEESLERELRRATRKSSHLGVVMLDVDHFKRFNDTFGHEAGDFVLQGLAKLFRTHFRGEDIVCRYGGEEFALILPEASLEMTRQRTEELREAAKRIVPQHRGQPLEPITLSIGIASFPNHGTTGDVLLQAADSALYQAKHQGRDRVVAAFSGTANRNAATATK